METNGIKRRRVFALCIAGYNWDYETRIAEGVVRRCRELGIDLVFFNPLMARQGRDSWFVLPESIVKGENEIFRLMNYKVLDGIIMKGDSFLSHETAPRMLAMAAQNKVPVVDIDDIENSGDIDIKLSDSTAMTYLIDHLIEVHGMRRIAFIGGFADNNVQTADRLAAYKASLEAHGIEYDDDLVGYGNFWQPAYNVTEKFLKLAEPPQAIACANDTMAFFAIDCIIDHGLRVPEDILVTGFDGIAESQTHTPSVTTARHAYITAGEKAVDALMEKLEGGEVPESITVFSEMLPGQSCGCMPPRDSADTFQEYMTFRNKIMEFNTYLIEINTCFAASKDSTELYLDCQRGSEYFGMKQLSICISDTVESGIGNVSSGDVYDGGSDGMRVMFDMNKRFEPGTYFPAAKLTPVGVLGRDEPVFITVSPLHFKNQFLGYIAYERDSLDMEGDLFTNWVMAISNGAGSFYMRNQLEYVVRKLEDLYVRDPMTNLFNRRGMLRFGEELISEALRKKQTVTVFSVDIDNLKPINDNYGHLGGDNAICQAGKAINTALPQGSVVARTGGDEFCAICSSLEPGEEQGYLDKIDEILLEYGKTSGMPYTVGVSGGYHSVPASGYDSLDSMMRLADIEMYKVKLAKKTVRK